MDFKSKVIVLSGIGRAGQVGDFLARAFASHGATLQLLGRNHVELDARAGELRALHVPVETHACDLSDARAAEDAARAVAARTDGRIDALVHVAGGFALSGPVAESAVDGWQQQLSINLGTAYATTRAFLPLLRAGRGSALYFASAAALPGASVAGVSGYAVAKTALVTLMRAVAAEEARHGVRANALAPAAIRTASNVAAMGPNATYVEPDALCDVVLFLVSNASRAISGQVIAVG